MVLLTIVTGVYKPIYNWGAPHCRDLEPPILGNQLRHRHRMLRGEAVEPAGIATQSLTETQKARTSNEAGTSNAVITNNCDLRVFCDD